MRAFAVGIILAVPLGAMAEAPRPLSHPHVIDGNFDGDRDEKSVFETAHTADVRLDAEGVATWTVHREIVNRATTAQEVRWRLELPPGGVMQTARMQEGTTWFTGARMDVEKALDAYDKKTDAKGPRPSMILQLDEPGWVEAVIGPLAPSAKLVLEYTVVGPSQYADGKTWLIYPKTVDASTVAPVVTVSSHKAVAATVGDTIEFAIDHAPITGPWVARYGRVIGSSKHVYARLEVDAAPQLSTLPVRSQIVFVVDASWSMDTDGVDAQLGMIAAYVANVPDAEIEIVAFRRTAAPVFGAFVPAAELAKRLAAAKAAGAFALGNGSMLDDAIARSIPLLAARTGPRRLVLGTDAQLRSALTPAKLVAALAKLPSDVVVHVLEPDQYQSANLKRDDTVEIAKLATSHHGIHATFHELDQRSALSLVRPIAIEKLVVTGAALEDGDRLEEGQGLRLVTRLTSLPARATITGMLWSDPVKLTVAPTPAFDRRTAQLLFGAWDVKNATDKEQLAFENLATGVTWGIGILLLGRDHVKPDHGYGEGGRGYRATIPGPGRSSTRHVLAVGTVKPQVNLHELVDGLACQNANPGQSATIAVEVGVNYEIDDVTIEGKSSALATCVAEAFWAARATAKFRGKNVANYGPP